MASKPMSRAEVEQYSAERLAQMRECGIKHVEILGCNYAPDECESFRAMRGEKIETEFATPLPLPGCDKEFCKCIWIAVDPEADNI